MKFSLRQVLVGKIPATNEYHINSSYLSTSLNLTRIVHIFYFFKENMACECNIELQKFQCEMQEN